ncbi:MAG TPA: arabinofuranosidase catalytic domain-containing protein, partial [Polyangia bacterium]|nr:arabinofuranosidase catalytic domain-containing protein [Polyangia bacterium]
EGGAPGAGGTSAAAGPCDIYAAASTPCVGAHSTVRALYQAYSGNLYQVRRASDKTTKDIPVLAPGGVAASAQQDAFCMGTTCTISIIYDQSPQGNHLPVSPPVHWLPNGGKEADAGAAKIMLGGHVVYGVLFPADSTFTYRNNKTKGVATGDQPESMYMVADGKRYNSRCCFDYGNVETTGNDDGNGTMETLNWSNITEWSQGAGSGPWVMADLENGVFAGGGAKSVPTNTPLVAKYVTLVLKGPAGNHWSLKAGDAQAGALAVKYDGARPAGYSPMKKEGALELGVGGDGSGGGTGIFFEGAVTAGNPTDAADDAVQANVVAAGYGR